jgi:WD40 repeat protein
VARLLALPSVHDGGGGKPLSLVSVGRDHRMRLWDVAAFAQLPTSPGSGGGDAASRKSFFSTPALAFPAPSAPLASVVCELVGGPTAAPITSAIAYGVTHVIASAEHTVRIWRHNRRDAISGGSGALRTLAPVAALPVGAAQSALAGSLVGGTGTTGGLLAGGGIDGGVSVWDLGASTALRKISGYASRVHKLLWLPPPDGRLVTCAVGRGEALKFWDVRSGACTGAYALDSRLLCSALLPDGRLVSGANYDPLIRVWALTAPGSLEDAAAAAAAAASAASGAVEPGPRLGKE